jgi:hypothetical protein
MIINLADPNIVISDRPRDSADLFNRWIANLEIKIKNYTYLVQLCVKSWRIETGNLNAEGPLVSAEVRGEFAMN